jgi:hypothetical protein
VRIRKSGRWGPYRQASPPPARHRPDATKWVWEMLPSIVSHIGQSGSPPGCPSFSKARRGLPRSAACMVARPRLGGVERAEIQVPEPAGCEGHAGQGLAVRLMREEGQDGGPGRRHGGFVVGTTKPQRFAGPAPGVSWNHFGERPRPDSNRGMTVLQTVALPLGDEADLGDRRHVIRRRQRPDPSSDSCLSLLDSTSPAKVRACADRDLPGPRVENPAPARPPAPGRRRAGQGFSTTSRPLVRECPGLSGVAGAHPGSAASGREIGPDQCSRKWEAAAGIFPTRRR